VIGTELVHMMSADSFCPASRSPPGTVLLAERSRISDCRAAPRVMVSASSGETACAMIPAVKEAYLQVFDVAQHGDWEQLL
jgi:hypothetical protein